MNNDQNWKHVLERIQKQDEILSVLEQKLLLIVVDLITLGVFIQVEIDIVSNR